MKKSILLGLLICFAIAYTSSLAYAAGAQDEKTSGITTFDVSGSEMLFLNNTMDSLTHSCVLVSELKFVCNNQQTFALASMHGTVLGFNSELFPLAREFVIRVQDRR